MTLPPLCNFCHQPMPALDCRHCPKCGTSFGEVGSVKLSHHTNVERGGLAREPDAYASETYKQRRPKRPGTVRMIAMIVRKGME